MPKAIRFHKTGGPEVLVWEEVEVGDPGPGQVRIRQHAVGLNFIDTYQRSGLYPMPLPSGTGSRRGRRRSGRGGRDRVQAGDRVAYASAPLGAYSEAGSSPRTGRSRSPTASPSRPPRR